MMLGYRDFALLELDLNQGHQRFRFTDDRAQSGAITCPVCGEGKTVNIAWATDRRHFVKTRYRWMVCQDCCGASISIYREGGGEEIYPPRTQQQPIDNLPGDVAEMWEEANLTYSVGAYTSAVLMCRKIVFAAAVRCGLPEKNDRGWAPSFEECVKFLVNEGILTQRIKDSWADSIRLWGNAATHELKSVRQSTALKAIEFTQMILRMAFEFEGNARAENES